jgi:hypothetical protein
MRLMDLERRCRVIEGSVRQRRLARADELAAVCPGGPENPERGFPGALRWYGHLCGFLEREDSSAPQRRAADAALMAALAELPKDLPLTVTQGPDGTPLTLRVYPKGLLTLLDCEVRNLVLRALTMRVEALRATPPEVFGPDHAVHLDKASRELGRQLCMFAWIATSPGPGFPYPEDADPEPNPPEHIAALDPWDLYQICQAWREVNVGRLQMADTLAKAPAAGTEGGMSWSILYSTVGEAHHKDPKRLLRDRSLANVLASVRLGHPEPAKKSARGGAAAAA